MEKFLTSNDWQYRLFRTIIQGILGVIVANLDYITGIYVIDPGMKGVIVAFVMAVLSPIMALLGAKEDGEPYEPAV